MDSEKEIKQLKEKIAYYEQIIRETSVPIIPSIVKDTILVPISGHLEQDRFNLIRSRVLDYIGNKRETNCAVFDFTGVQTKEVSEMDYDMLAIEISQLNTALKLMGTRPIYVGFNPYLVREIVAAGVHVDIETYVNFKTALAILLNEEGKTLHSL